MSVHAGQTHWPNAAVMHRRLWIACIALLLASVALTTHMGLEPYWVALAAPALAIVAILVWRFPIALMVAMIYVGMFKPRHAVGFSLTDPTLLTAGLLDLAIALRVMLAATGHEGLSLSKLFAGQKWRVLAYLLLIVIIAISCVYTPAPLIGDDKALKLISFDVPLFLAPLILLHTKDDVRELVIFNLLAGLALTGLTIYRVMHPSAVDLVKENDPTQIGAGLAIGATLLTVFFCPITNRRLLRLALLGCAAILTVGVAASLSRSAIFGVVAIAGCSVPFLKVDTQALSRKAILLMGVLVIVTASVALMWVQHLPDVYNKFEAKAQELQLFFHQSDATGTMEERFSFSSSAWHAFLDKPVLGWGAGGWSTLWHYTDGRVVTYPHDFVLEIAAEQGVAGLAALGLLLFGIWKASREVLKSTQRWAVFIVPVVGLTLLGNAVTGEVDARAMWFWCGVLFALARITCEWLPMERRGALAQFSWAPRRTLSV